MPYTEELTLPSGSSIFWYESEKKLYFGYPQEGFIETEINLTEEDIAAIKAKKPITVVVNKILSEKAFYTLVTECQSIAKIKVCGKFIAKPNIVQALNASPQLKHLTVADLSSGKVLLEIVELVKNKSLEGLELESSIISSAFIAALCATQLKKLDISGSIDPPPDLFLPLAKSTSICELTLPTLPSLETIKAIISKMSQLTLLEINHDQPYTEPYICAIAGNKSLKTLSIPIGRISTKAAKSLSDMTSLQTLILTATDASDQAIEEINHAFFYISCGNLCNTLTSIELTGICLDKWTATALSKMPQLQNVSINILIPQAENSDNDPTIEPQQIKDMVLCLAKSTSITSLSLSNITNKFVYDDADLDDDLDHSFTLTPKIAKALAQMTSLQSLTLDLSSIKFNPAAEVLEELAKSTSLFQLDFVRSNGNKIIWEELLKLFNNNADKTAEKSITDALEKLNNRICHNYRRAHTLPGIVMLAASYRANEASLIKDSILDLLPEIMAFLGAPPSVKPMPVNPNLVIEEVLPTPSTSSKDTLMKATSGLALPAPTLSQSPHTLYGIAENNQGDSGRGNKRSRLDTDLAPEASSSASQDQNGIAPHSKSS